jgi:hypothetical protein
LFIIIDNASQDALTTVMETSAPPQTRQCSKSACGKKLPPSYPYKTCERCREWDAEFQRKKQKRKREEAIEEAKRKAHIPPSNGHQNAPRDVNMEDDSSDNNSTMSEHPNLLAI